MDIRQIKIIMKEFESSSITTFEMSDKEFSLKLEKKVSNDTEKTPIYSHPIQEEVQKSSDKNSETMKEEYLSVTSPLVGTFYDKPSPDGESFVKVNDYVKKGDTLFIIEAMKVMNEISAPIDGKIMAIHSGNDELVEFGQIIMEIKG